LVTERSLYLLDTSVVIDISKNIEPATSLVGGWLAGSNEMGVCQVVVAEFFNRRAGNQATGLDSVHRASCLLERFAQGCDAGRHPSA
jgi:predicted nucleic acid-binding protein